MMNETFNEKIVLFILAFCVIWLPINTLVVFLFILMIIPSSIELLAKLSAMGIKKLADYLEGNQ